jgi:predicted RecA/RadA family phage recombinase
MASEAINGQPHGVVQITAAAALTAGDIIETGGGAGYVLGGDDVASGGYCSVQTAGRVDVAKAASVAMLPGQTAYWSIANSNASYTGDFAIGTVVEDAGASAARVKVDLNHYPHAVIEFGRDRFNTAATDGLGVTQVAVGSPTVKLAFDAVAEVAMAALYSEATVALSRRPIMDAWIAIYDVGDNAALDINVGMANATHATDADAITEAVFIHVDGNALSANVESDDGTTEVAADDTTIDFVDDTWAFVQFDLRNVDDVKVYINGVDAGAAADVTLVLSAAAGPVLPLFHMEKTSDNTTADLRVHSCRVTCHD